MQLFPYDHCVFLGGHLWEKGKRLQQPLWSIVDNVVVLFQVVSSAD